MLAAEATECAADQQHFWAYHDQLFANQVPQHNVGNFSKDSLRRLAGSIGLDQASFSTCLDSDRYGPWVQRESNGAVQRGVTGTPWLFLNGQTLQPTPASFDDLRTLIRQAGGR